MANFNYLGTNVVYELAGTGPTLVFVHGFCEDSRIWDDFKKPFLDQYQILTFDLPGFGQSDINGSFSIKGYAQLLKALVDHLEIKTFTLIGHSMGGYASLAFAEDYSSYLNGLGLFHSHPYPDTADKKAHRSKSMEFVERNGSAPYVAQVIPNLFAPDYAKANAEFVDDLVQKAALYPSAGLTNALAAMRDRPDRSGVLKTNEVPVLFILGKLDTAIPYDGSIAQTILPNIAQVELMETVGHMGMFEATEQTQEMLKTYLQLVHSFGETPRKI